MNRDDIGLNVAGNGLQTNTSCSPSDTLEHRLSKLNVNGDHQMKESTTIAQERNTMLSAHILNVPNPSPRNSESLYSTDPRECVQLRVVEDQDGLGSLEALTVHSFLARAVENWGHKNAMAYKIPKKDTEWHYLTYSDYYRLSCVLAKAFIQLGLERGKGVCILGFNSPEWFIANMATIFAGGLSCGVYATNNPEACHHILDDCQAQIVLVENGPQLEKILAVRDRLPQLKTIIIWQRDPKTPLPTGVMQWTNALRLGESQSDDELTHRLLCQVPNQCCSLIYTSGTTGNPKGVMLSHDNLVWTARWMEYYLEFVEGSEERIVSYLPLSHVAAQITDIYTPINIGSCMYFAQPDALRGSLRQTLCEVRPTMMVAVPRVFEKMEEKMKEVGSNMGWPMQYLASWAKSIGYAGSVAVVDGTPKPWGWTLAHNTVLYRAKYALGLDQCRLLASTAAPLSKDTMHYFMSLDMPICQVYGMSECSGPHTFNKLHANRVLSAGLCPNGSRLKLGELDEEGNGEVCMFGRNVFMGYLHSEDKTKEAIDEDGWLHSGDLGRIDEDGFLFITGRIKELIITAGGENVAPIPIEERIREVLPCISHCMLVGDKRKYISVLLTFKTEVDEVNNQPLDELTPMVKQWCKTHNNGVAIDTVSELRATLPEGIRAAITSALRAVNEASVSRAAYVQKFIILPRDFSIVGGEFGPTMKMRRSQVMRMYEKEIDEMYRND